MKAQHFIEMNEALLEKCSHIGDLHLCYESFLELDNIHLTCLTALYLNASLSVIKEICEVDYIFDPFRPPPEVIHIGSQLILGGLNQPWRYQCVNDRIPTDLDGAPYAVIDRASLCQCRITANNGHLARRVTNCEGNPQPYLKIHYVMNAIVTETFPNLTTYLYEADEQIKEQNPFSLPKRNTLQKLRELQMRNMMPGIILLRKLTQLIDEQTNKFEREWELLSVSIAFDAWFSKSQWPKALAFIGEILGSFAFVLSCYLLCVHNHAGGMVNSMMFVSAPHATQAASVTTYPTVQLAPSTMLELSFAHLLCEAFCYLLLQGSPSI